MPRHALAVIPIMVALACGDGAGLPDGPGRYDSPADFDRAAAGCVPGALAGLDPAGIYHFQADYGDGLIATGAARLDRLAAGGFGGVLAGGEATRAWADDDDLFLYRELGGGRERSLLVCARDGAELGGAFAFCTEEGCYLAAVRGRRVERLAEAAAGGLVLLGEHQGAGWGPAPTVNVRVADDLAYLARYQDGLRIVDVSDPAAPVDVGHGPCEHADGGEIYNDVKLIAAGGRRFAVLASDQAGAVVWDVTTPSAPAIVAHLGTAEPGEGAAVHTLFLDGGRAYLANLRRGLEIWDLTAPAAPVKLGELALAGAPDGAFLHDLYVEGDRAYLNYWSAGLVIVDVADPAAPRVLGRFAGYGETTSHSSWVTTVGGRRIAAHGDEQWGSHLRLVDVTEGGAGFAREVGAWQTRPEVSAHNVMAAGDEVVVAHYQDGVRVIDIADLARRRRVAWFNTWPGYDRAYGTSFFEGAIGVDLDVARGRIFVADTHRGLLVLARP